MTDNDASPSQQRHLHPAPTSTSPNGRRSIGSASYDTGGSSSGGDRRVLSSPGDTFTTTDSTLVFSSPGHPLPDRGDRDVDGARYGRGNTTKDPTPRPTSTERDGPYPRRSHKPRSAGGFLLSNSLLGGGRDSAPAHSRGLARKELHSASDRKGKKPSHSQHQQSSVIDARIRAYEYNNGDDAGRANGDRLQGGAGAGYDDMLMEQPTTGQDMVGTPAQSSSNQPSAFDADSAQIVNMALNLSESRRVAARRNISSPLPPRLAPIPDHPQTGGSLKQHLQQQRRSSRTVSPSQRVVSGQRIPSLPATIEAEPGYSYHFSASTLARAQKAKEHLELMAQYRRLLEIIPPLDPSNLSHSTTLGPPNSSGNGVAPLPLAGGPVITLGRPYNPLRIHQKPKAATRPAYSSPASSLPPFLDAEPDGGDGAQAGSSIPTVTIAKPRRPRVDWVIDPADMIADVYWLEQNDHKMLIEDRHWRRIFPQDSGLYARPASTQEDKAGITQNGATTGSEGHSSLRPPEVKPVKAKTAPATVSEQLEAPLHNARERARNKLHDLKGKHHKHSPSAHGSDFLRLRRGSLDDSSDSDSDARRRRVRKGTISAHSKDVLEKQMMELIAKEAREKEFEPQTADASLSPIKPPPNQPPIPQELGKKKSGSRSHHRKESKLTDISDAEDKGFRFRSKTSSPLISARQSLDIPGHARVNSMDLDSSLPNSPDLRPSRGESGLIPPIGLDLSPPTSRPSSPSRNPFSKVKQKIFRDRSRDRSGESKLDERDATEEAPDTSEKPVEENYRKSLDGRSSVDKTRPSSPSPVRRLAGKTTGDSQKEKGHNRMGSLRIRDEIGGPRGIFKNPRIDAIIRGSVSKVGDLIWRKGQYNQDSDSDTTTDDSDVDELRGRNKDPSASPNGNGSGKRPPDASPHSVKHYLDVMPPFIAAPSRGTTTPSEYGDGQTRLSPPTSPSQKRFDRLKPPRIDVQVVSPTASPPNFPLPRSRDSDRSTTGSRSRPASYIEGARRSSNQLNSVLLGMPPPNIMATRPNRLSMATIQSRTWSVSEIERFGSSSEVVAHFVSRKEVARARTLMLSTGIKALEISRRANKAASLSEADSLHPAACLVQGQAVRWGEVASLVPEDKKFLAGQQVTQTQIFALAAQVLSASISSSTNAFHRSANEFAQRSIPALGLRITCIRERVSDDLSTRVRAASDDADGLARDLVAGQRMKVRRTNEVMDTMFRRRRRRFRWLRRAGWLGVEWALVGFMWYVWLMVMLVRVVLGTVRTVGRGVKWLLWL